MKTQFGLMFKYSTSSISSLVGFFRLAPRALRCHGSPFYSAFSTLVSKDSWPDSAKMPTTLHLRSETKPLERRSPSTFTQLGISMWRFISCCVMLTAELTAMVGIQSLQPLPRCFLTPDTPSTSNTALAVSIVMKNSPQLAPTWCPKGLGSTLPQTASLSA